VEIGKITEKKNKIKRRN